MGIPQWDIVSKWLGETLSLRPPDAKKPKISLSNNIKQLSDYENPASAEFWSNFPKRTLPKKPITRINVKAFEKEVNKVRNKMSSSEQRRAGKVLHDLKFGASSCQKSELPPISCNNAKTALKYGELLTDKLASWIKQEFVAGPFDCPPMPGFRVNPLGAVERNNKVRPILNMSGPRGASFNDNIDRLKLEKLNMATAKQFSHELRRCGTNATFSKFDICDAYKMVPVAVSEFRLQGFQWLGSFFCETQLTFGGANSPCIFDRFSKTKDLVVCLNSNTPRDRLFRVLDDTPCVAPENSNIVKEFSTEMRAFCKRINLPLAENCPHSEKAFENQRKGVVLGIGFNSENMSWYITKQKKENILERCSEACKSLQMELRKAQKLMGTVNDFAQMCPFMRFHTSSGNRFLAEFNNREDISIQIPVELKKDLEIIMMVAASAEKGMPIAEVKTEPPVSSLVFFTDAAGCSFTMSNGKRICHSNQDRGVSCIGGESVDAIWSWAKMLWPAEFISTKKDEQGNFFGSKSTTLEAIGLLLPFLAFPKAVMARHVTFMVDNIGVLYGWNKGFVKKDKTATAVLKALFYVSAFLGCTVHVRHVNRNSCEMSTLADEMSRSSEPKDKRIADILGCCKLQYEVTELDTWLKNPVDSENLSSLLIDIVKNRSLI